ncbi:PHP domain-containing protein [bacterium]|nr:PHP domain-containing protein [bacterium]
MKRNFVKIIILFFVLIMTGLCIYVDTYRYHIDKPMQDIEYKKSIIRDSKNIKYNLEALRPLMGPEELTKFIKDNDNNPQIYTPSKENINSGKYRANLHMHTTMSDGEQTVEYRMNEAQNYAQNHIKDGYLVIAITDHNTVLGAKEVIKVLEQNPKKYKNIKVIAGIEINSIYYTSHVSPRPIDIHILLWAINPYDKFLETEFYKKDYNDKWNIKIPIKDFNEVISNMAPYGIVGIAHPTRYNEDLGNKKYPYITELFTQYKSLIGKVKFTEAYYQSYKQTQTGPLLGNEYDKYINYINSEAKRLGIIRTGSTDAHGKTIFGYK